MIERIIGAKLADRLLPRKQFGDERGEIGEHAVGAGALEGEQRFQHRLFAIDPAIRAAARIIEYSPDTW